MLWYSDVTCSVSVDKVVLNPLGSRLVVVSWLRDLFPSVHVMDAGGSMLGTSQMKLLAPPGMRHPAVGLIITSFTGTDKGTTNY